jgi:hypothetical protein
MFCGVIIPACWGGEKAKLESSWVNAALVASRTLQLAEYFKKHTPAEGATNCPDGCLGVGQFTKP